MTANEIQEQMISQIQAGFVNVLTEYSTVIFGVIAVLIILFAINLIIDFLWKASALNTASSLYDDMGNKRGYEKDIARMKYKKHLREMDRRGWED